MDADRHAILSAETCNHKWFSGGTIKVTDGFENIKKLKPLDLSKVDIELYARQMPRNINWF